MDYTQYKQLEFRRKFLKIFGASITVFEGTSNTVVGYIKMKAWRLRSDIRLYSDSSMSDELLLISARNLVRLNRSFDVVDSHTNQALFTLQHHGLQSVFKRDYWDIIDPQGSTFGAVKETSGWLAIARRWIAILPYIGDFIELALAFTPQTFDILSLASTNSPVVAGKLVHRKNPVIVKMGLDTTMAPADFDPRIGVATAALLCVLDATKQR